MKRRHRPLMALGLLAPACSPAPTAHRGTPTDQAAVTAPTVMPDSRPGAEDVSPTSSAGSAPTTTEATTTTHVVTVPTDPPTTIVVRPRPLPTTTLPEYDDEGQSDEEYWKNQPGYSGVWPELAECESGNANVDTGNGYSGYFQFSDATWRSMGTGYARAVDAPYAVQLDAAQRLQARSGWGQWPACSRKLGLR